MNIITFMTKGKLMPTYFRERWDLRNLQTERQPQRPKKADNRPAKEISPLFMQIICVSVFCNLSCICTGCTLVESLHWLNRTAAANKTEFTCSLVVLVFIVIFSYITIKLFSESAGLGQPTALRKKSRMNLGGWAYSESSTFYVHACLVF